MKPKITNLNAWQQAELLMQPAFIRLIDNIRKQLDQSTWKGTYQDIMVWPEGTSPEVQAQVMQLRQQLDTASPDEVLEIEQALSHLPNPYLGYQLRLQHQDQEVNVDLWDLCYQICFQNYPPTNGKQLSPDSSESQTVEIDTSLIDETGDVDWNRLDLKAQQVVQQVFEHLSE